MGVHTVHSTQLLPLLYSSANVRGGVQAFSLAVAVSEEEEEEEGEETDGFLGAPQISWNYEPPARLRPD